MLRVGVSKRPAIATPPSQPAGGTRVGGMGAGALHVRPTVGAVRLGTCDWKGYSFLSRLFDTSLP
jgi:hypothetical protein